VNAISVLNLLRRGLCAASAIVCLHATAADVRVVAPNASREAISEAASRFEKSSGHRVIISWTGTEAITKRIMDGEVADIVVNAAQNIERLSSDGKLLQGSRTDFARSSIGIALAPGLPRPDISSIDGLKATLLAAKSIVISSGTSGRHLADLFARLGVREQIKTKIRQPPSGVQIGDFLASGEVELGFQQVSELIHVQGIQFLGPLPEELQSYTIYAAAAHSQAAQPEAAQAFLMTLRQPETAVVVRQSGMEPMSAK